jgi:hypothetical protein
VGLENGTSDYYAVAARNSRGEGPASAEASTTPDALDSAVNPRWAGAAPLRTISLEYDPLLSSEENGARLKAAIQTLEPGSRLEVGAGTWSIRSFFSINLRATARAPIFIAAKEGAKPRITRPDAQQNAINFGSGGVARYVAFQGFEVTGGDTAIRLWDCEDVWIDSCHIHDCGGVGIEANSVDTARLTITRNEIHGTAGVGEGIYLGANFGEFVTHGSVVALNHVHGTGGRQGDGIEVKQGSWGNWIVANTVHDTPYPCILVYGTGGLPANLIERNICYRSQDNVMQVQGEAVVRNNLLMNGACAFRSGDHQGTVGSLIVVHITMVNPSVAVSLEDWSGKRGMAFANNNAYSRDAEGIRIRGSSEVEFAGNVVLGSVVGVAKGWRSGGGLEDFAGVSWDASRREATPVQSSPIVGAGDPAWAVSCDLSGALRSGPLDSGCIEAR